jgi:hypothetical protein
MYKIASDLAQRRARQLWLADIGAPEFQALTLEQQRDSLVAKVKAINAQLAKYPDESDWRTAIIQVKREVEAQINAIRPQLRGERLKNLDARIVEVVKERLTPFLFRQIVNEAVSRVKAAESSSDPTSASQEKP